ncbi:MAG: octanoyltransferase [Legionellaceae bacterium]|nr:octanoyltransferase [Legionellaceae bacterium]HAF87424.1 octanoyltransferase [Legionellales bacterium]HCA89239.1 octanoyltransferase [Legionellales bacterium]|tara:strand:+ start:775 stop:1377 length:603 start_codon:yes stop_codon:yes gene_type:complete
MNFRHIGQQDYLTVWQQMKTFTLNRTKITEDECWFVEHPPVYTQGQAGKAQHIINPKDIPIVQSDRGGQVTYHGPGQLVVYVLFDLSRAKLGIRTLVNLLEQTLIELLNDYKISATTRCQAPGVYVNEQKIASIGLRVKNHCTYHGFALNVDMDLTPFKGINPCGFENMEMTQIKNFVAMLNMTDVTKRLQTLLAQSLNV